MSIISNEEIKVLYLEDDKASMQMVRKVFNTISEDFPIKLDYANNGQEGLSFFKKSNYNYDIIFTDIRMPLMDGIEFIRKIKQLKKEQVIIIMSAYDFSDLTSTSSGLKVSGYLNKPIRINKIYNIIQDYSLVSGNDRCDLNISKELQVKRDELQKLKDEIEKIEIEIKNMENPKR